MKKLVVFICVVLMSCGTAKNESFAQIQKKAPMLHKSEVRNKKVLRYETFIKASVSVFPEDITLKIYATKGWTWPGKNLQFVEISNGSKILKSQEIGGEPAMISAWTALSKESLMLYIKCRHRWGNYVGVHIYRIDSKYKIIKQAIYIDEETSKKAAVEWNNIDM